MRRFPTVLFGICLVAGIVLSLPLSAQTDSDSGGLPAKAGEAPLRPDFVAGIRFSSEYDDAAGSARGLGHDFRSLVEPNFLWTAGDAREQWQLSYRPILSFSHRLKLYDSVSHSAHAAFRSAFTRRMQLKADGGYQHSSNPFDRFQALSGSFGDANNISTFAPVATTTGGNGSVDLTYDISRFKTIGIRGEYAETRYLQESDLTAVPGALDWKRFGGDVYFSQRFSKSQYTSVRYSARQLIFSAGRSAMTQAVQYVHTVVLSPNVRISGFIGPENTVVDLPRVLSSVQGAGWSYTGGGDLRWAAGRFVTSAMFTRAAGASTDAQGPVRFQTGTLTVETRLSKNWRSQMSLHVIQNDPLESSSRSVRYISTVGGLTRTFPRDISLNFLYWRVQTDGTGIGTAGYFVDHNRASISLNYQFLGSR